MSAADRGHHEPRNQMILFRHSDHARQPDCARDERWIAGHSQDIPAIQFVRLAIGDALAEIPISLRVAHDEKGTLFDDVQIVLQPKRSGTANGERRQNNPEQRTTVNRQIRRLIPLRRNAPAMDAPEKRGILRLSL